MIFTEYLTFSIFTLHPDYFQLRTSPSPVWALGVVKLSTPWPFLPAIVDFYHMFVWFPANNIPRGTPCRFLELFLCLASSSVSLPHKFYLPLPFRTQISVPSTQWYPSALLEIPFLQNWFANCLYTGNQDNDRVHFVSLFSGIIVLYCLFSSVWKQSFDIYFPVF